MAELQSKAFLGAGWHFPIEPAAGGEVALAGPLRIEMQGLES